MTELLILDIGINSYDNKGKNPNFLKLLHFLKSA